MWAPWLPRDEVEDELTEKREAFMLYYESNKGKLNTIPYSCVPLVISKDVAEQVRYSHNNEWKDLVAELGTKEIFKIKKLEHEEKNGGNLGLFTYLTTTFCQEKNGTLGTLIQALVQEEHYDTLLKVQGQVKDFLDSYEPESQRSDLPSLESGFSEPSLFSSTSSQSHNGNSLRSSYGRTISGYQSLTQSAPIRQEVLQSHNLDFKYGPAHQELVKPTQSYIFTNDPCYSPDGNHPNYGDLSKVPNNLSGEPDKGLDPYSFLDEHFKGESKETVSVFILHTAADEDVARELARVLENEYQFIACVLRDMDALFIVDLHQYLLHILEKIDFIVPVLSETYLQEICAEGNPNEMPDDRLAVRYIHKISQTRMLNQNSRNFDIRPVMLDGVPLGKVRKYLEFQCPHKYPKDLKRFANILTTSKTRSWFQRSR